MINLRGLCLQSTGNWKEMKLTRWVGSDHVIPLNIMLRIFVSAKVQCKGMEYLNRGDDIIGFAF